MYKTKLNVEKYGEMQEDGKMGVHENFHITVENEKGNIVFSWQDHTEEEANNNMKRFNEIQNDKVALKVFITEIKSRYQ